MADLLKTADWWVVYVRGVDDLLGCVYGGRTDTVLRAIAAHEEWAGPTEVLKTYPFDSGTASMLGRVEIERKYAA